MDPGPHRAVSSESDCRSRDHKFDLSPVPYFVEIGHEIILRAILLLPLIQGVFHSQAKVCARSTG